MDSAGLAERRKNRVRDANVLRIGNVGALGAGLYRSGDVPRRGSVFRYRHQGERRKDEKGELRDLMNVRERRQEADECGRQCNSREHLQLAASGEDAEIS